MTATSRSRRNASGASATPPAPAATIFIEAGALTSAKPFDRCGNRNPADPGQREEGADAQARMHRERAREIRVGKPARGRVPEAEIDRREELAAAGDRSGPRRETGNEDKTEREARRALRRCRREPCEDGKARDTHE